MAHETAGQAAARAVGGPLRRGFTRRSVAWSLVLLVASVFWIRQAELISFTCQISEATPPVPGLAALLLFAALNPFLRRVRPQWVLQRAELAVVFVFVSVGSVMSAVGVTQAFLPYLTVPHYFPPSGTKLELISAYLPAWLGPRDPEVIRTFFEGSDFGIVPWAAWAKPLALWLGFFVAFWWTALCVWVCFRAQWVERERLTFPIVSIPVRLTEEGSIREPPFLRNRMMWIGFSLVLAYHVLNVIHIINPSVAAPGPMYQVGQLFTERPLNALAGLSIWHRPELIGLGFLVPLEILFSVWFLFVLEQLATVAGAVIGVDVPGYPFPSDQGMGAYVLMAFALVWMARHHLVQVFRRALTGARSVTDSDEPLPYGVAVFGGLLGLLVLILFAVYAGVGVWVAALFFGLLFTFSLVYCRIRCESGTPSIWVLPHSDLKFLPFRMFGSDAFKVGGTYQVMSSWTTFFFLVHGGFYNQSTVYQMESFRLADDVRAPRRDMVSACLSAVVIGLVLAFWMFLSTYYEYGTNVLAGGARTGTGGVRIDYCLQSWLETSNYIAAPAVAEKPRRIAFGVGAAITLALIVARSVTLRSILSPLGYIMAAVNGTQLWWAFLIAWSVKALVLRLGGVSLYRRLVPLFLGIAVGQFFIGGVVWGTLAIFIPDVEYVIWFT